MEKDFLYGALVWLTVESGVGLIASAVACMAFLTGIEVVQMFLDGRTSEITDPLLVLLMTLTWYFVDLRPNAKEARAKELALATVSLWR